MMLLELQMKLKLDDLPIFGNFGESFNNEKYISITRKLF